MSICTTGWLDESCPCLDDYWRVEGFASREWGCALGVFKHHDYDKLPNTCPHAEALRIAEKNLELILVAIPKHATKFSQYPSDGAYMVASGVHGYHWWQQGIYGWQRKEWEAK